MENKNEENNEPNENTAQIDVSDKLDSNSMVIQNDSHKRDCNEPTEQNSSRQSIDLSKAPLPVIHFKIGDNVKLNAGHTAIVKYIGPTQFDEKEVIGLQLDRWTIDGHNGTVDGVDYFKAPNGTGCFTKRTNISNIIIPLVKPLPNKTKISNKLNPLKIGDMVRLISNQNLATIKYIGYPKQFAQGEVIGIRLDKWTKNAHNGHVNGKYIFDAAPGFGLFVRRNELVKYNPENEKLQQRQKQLKLGDTIILSDKSKGMVKYIGPVTGHDLMVGLELDTWQPGLCDGKFEGFRYFTTAEGRGKWVNFIDNFSKKIIDIIPLEIDHEEKKKEKLSEEKKDCDKQKLGISMEKKEVNKSVECKNDIVRHTVGDRIKLTKGRFGIIDSINELDDGPLEYSIKITPLLDRKLMSPHVQKRKQNVIHIDYIRRNSVCGPKSTRQSQLLLFDDIKSTDNIINTVGETIELASDEIGTIRYVGPVHFAAGNWIGVELHDIFGPHNGSVRGIRYFECAPMRGIFVKWVKGIKKDDQGRKYLTRRCPECDGKFMKKRNPRSAYDNIGIVCDGCSAYGNCFSLDDWYFQCTKCQQTDFCLKCMLKLPEYNYAFNTHILAHVKSNEEQCIFDDSKADNNVFSLLQNAFHCAVNSNPLSLEIRDKLFYHVQSYRFNGKNVHRVLHQFDGPCIVLGLYNVLKLNGNYPINNLYTLLNIKYSTMMLQLEQHYIRMCNHSEYKNDEIESEITNTVIFQNNSCDNSSESIINYKTKNIFNTKSCPPFSTLILSKCQLNIKFNDVTDFETIPQIFNVFNIRIFHGLIIDPKNESLHPILVDKSLNQIADEIVNFFSSISRKIDQESILMIANFIVNNKRQITDYGLKRLHQVMKENELALLYTNHCFLPIYKYNGLIFELITNSEICHSHPTNIWKLLQQSEDDKPQYIQIDDIPLSIQQLLTYNVNNIDKKETILNININHQDNKEEKQMNKPKEENKIIDTCKGEVNDDLLEYYNSTKTSIDTNAEAYLFGNDPNSEKKDLKVLLELFPEFFEPISNAYSEQSEYKMSFLKNIVYFWLVRNCIIKSIEKRIALPVQILNSIRKKKYKNDDAFVKLKQIVLKYHQAFENSEDVIFEDFIVECNKVESPLQNATFGIGTNQWEKDMETNVENAQIKDEGYIIKQSKDGKWIRIYFFSPYLELDTAIYVQLTEISHCLYKMVPVSDDTIDNLLYMDLYIPQQLDKFVSVSFYYEINENWVKTIAPHKIKNGYGLYCFHKLTSMETLLVAFCNMYITPPAKIHKGKSVENSIIKHLLSEIVDFKSYIYLKKIVKSLFTLPLLDYNVLWKKQRELIQRDNTIINVYKLQFLKSIIPQKVSNLTVKAIFYYIKTFLDSSLLTKTNQKEIGCEICNAFINDLIEILNYCKITTSDQLCLYPLFNFFHYFQRFPLSDVVVTLQPLSEYNIKSLDLSQDLAMIKENIVNILDADLKIAQFNENRTNPIENIMLQFFEILSNTNQQNDIQKIIDTLAQKFKNHFIKNVKVMDVPYLYLNDTKDNSIGKFHRIYFTCSFLSNQTYSIYIRLPDISSTAYKMRVIDNNNIFTSYLDVFIPWGKFDTLSDVKMEFLYCSKTGWIVIHCINKLKRNERTFTLLYKSVLSTNTNIYNKVNDVTSMVRHLLSNVCDDVSYKYAASVSNDLDRNLSLFYLAFYKQQIDNRKSFIFNIDKAELLNNISDLIFTNQILNMNKNINDSHIHTSENSLSVISFDSNVDDDSKQQTELHRIYFFSQFISYDKYPIYLRINNISHKLFKMKRVCEIINNSLVFLDINVNSSLNTIDIEFLYKKNENWIQIRCDNRLELANVALYHIHKITPSELSLLSLNDLCKLLVNYETEKLKLAASQITQHLLENIIDWNLKTYTYSCDIFNCLNLKNQMCDYVYDYLWQTQLNQLNKSPILPNVYKLQFLKSILTDITLPNMTLHDMFMITTAFVNDISSIPKKKYYNIKYSLIGKGIYNSFVTDLQKILTDPLTISLPWSEILSVFPIYQMFEHFGSENLNDSAIKKVDALSLLIGCEAMLFKILCFENILIKNLLLTANHYLYSLMDKKSNPLSNRLDKLFCGYWRKMETFTSIQIPIEIFHMIRKIFVTL